MKLGKTDVFPTDIPGSLCKFYVKR